MRKNLLASTNGTCLFVSFIFFISVVFVGISLIDKNLWILNIASSIAVIFIIISLLRRSYVLGILILCAYSLVTMAFYMPIFGLVLSYLGEVDLKKLRLAISIRAILVVIILGLVWFRMTFVGFRKLLSDKRLVVIYIALIYLSIQFVYSPAPILNRFIYVGNSFLPLFLSLGIIYVQIKERAYFLSVEWYKVLSLIIAVAGLLYYINLDSTYFLFRPDLTTAIRSRNGLPIAYGDYPLYWSTTIEGMHLSRMFGSFPDAIIFGYFAATMLIVYFSKNKISLIAFYGILLVLSMSKGALIFIVLTIVLSYIQIRSFVWFWIMAAFFLFVMIISSLMLESSASVHTQGLIGSVNSLVSQPSHIIQGFGIGSGGNLARIAQFAKMNKGWMSSGSESGVGTILYQLGVAGLSLYFSAVLMVVRACQKLMKTQPSKNGKDISLLSSMILSVFINSFLQENLINSSVWMMVLATSTLLLSGSPMLVPINDRVE